MARTHVKWSYFILANLLEKLEEIWIFRIKPISILVNLDLDCYHVQPLCFPSQSALAIYFLLIVFNFHRNVYSDCMKPHPRPVLTLQTLKLRTRTHTRTHADEQNVGPCVWPDIMSVRVHVCLCLCLSVCQPSALEPNRSVVMQELLAAKAVMQLCSWEFLPGKNYNTETETETSRLRCRPVLPL